MYLHSLIFTLCFLYGSVFILGKLALHSVDPFFLTGSRMTLAGVILIIVQVLRKQNLRLEKTHLIPTILVAIFGVYLTNSLEFWGLQYMKSAKACFLYSLSPIIMALFSYAWFYEKITPQKWVGLTVGILGFIPLLLVPTPSENSSGHWWFFSYAELALMGASVTNAISWLAMRENVKTRQASPITINAYAMIIGGPLALMHSYVVEPWQPLPISNMSDFLLWGTLLMLISNLICYNLHGYLLRQFTATYLSLAGLSQPFFTAVLGWVILNEVLSAYFWFSFATVTLGLYVYYQEELKRGEAPSFSDPNGELD